MAGCLPGVTGARYQPKIGLRLGFRLLHRYFGKASEAKHYAQSVAERYESFCQSARQAAPAPGMEEVKSEQIRD